jgi:two-component system sensor histidine kinase DctS
MTQATVPAADASFDFALLQQSAARTGSRNRRALWWLLGLLALLLASVATLLLYLNNFEAEEAARRRAAEAQWLEQSVQFHFRRLEDDLLVLSRQAVQQSTGVGALLQEQSPDLKAGLLWREPGVILSSGWIPAGQLDDPRVGPERWSIDWDAHADNAEA